MSSSRVILDALRRRHNNPKNGNSRAWVYVEEVRVGPGFTAHPGEMEMDNPIRQGREQRIDAFAFHTWPSKRFRRIAYEVKTSRADLRHEFDHPEKSAAAMALSNEFYLVVGGDLSIIDFDIRSDWGILKLQGGRLYTIRDALWRDTPSPPYSFMLSVARTIQQREDAFPTHRLDSGTDMSLRQGTLI